MPAGLKEAPNEQLEQQKEKKSTCQALQHQPLGILGYVIKKRKRGVKSLKSLEETNKQKNRRILLRLSFID